MDTDRAYLLGLIVGGGIWGNAEDVFRIRLPYKQWGSYEANPQRAGEIASDVMRVVSPLFRVIYGLNISYDATAKGEWNILCEGDLTALREELEQYGIECEGEVRRTANISTIVPLLVDENLKRRFIAGLADTIGSTKQSHRRFTDDKQMISFEINGFEFKFVCALCKLLHSIHCYPDQVLWNHPNFHCGSNPYDHKWKKGFKLRVFLDQYEEFGAFAFTSKVNAATQNQALEKQPNTATPCSDREITMLSVSCVHCDENSQLLPEEIRGGHYLHNRHVCAVLSCENAPYGEVEKIISAAEHYINPFPVLLKGTKEEINDILNSKSIYKDREYLDIKYKIVDFLEHIKGLNDGGLLFGDGKRAGYPINKIILAITYLIAAKTGALNGQRPKGNKDKIISEFLRKEPEAEFFIKKPDLLTPIIVSMGQNSVMVGPTNPDVYKKLITRSDANPYKIRVREITEDDLNEKE